MMESQPGTFHDFLSLCVITLLIKKSLSILYVDKLELYLVLFCCFFHGSCQLAVVEILKLVGFKKVSNNYFLKVRINAVINGTFC